MRRDVAMSRKAAMVGLVAAVTLLALAACADRSIPADQSTERPDWLPVQPEHYERYPVPDEWRDENLAKRPAAALPATVPSGMRAAPAITDGAQSS